MLHDASSSPNYLFFWYSLLAVTRVTREGGRDGQNMFALVPSFSVVFFYSPQSKCFSRTPMVPQVSAYCFHSDTLLFSYELPFFCCPVAVFYLSEFQIVSPWTLLNCSIYFPRPPPPFGPMHRHKLLFWIVCSAQGSPSHSATFSDQPVFFVGLEVPPPRLPMWAMLAAEPIHSVGLFLNPQTVCFKIFSRGSAVQPFS